MSTPVLTEMLPATIGTRHIALELPWLGHGRLRVWLTPDRDVALDAVALVQLLEITEPTTYELHPVTWIHQWTPPITRQVVTAYLWSRDEALRAARLSGDARIADDFTAWLTETHRDIDQHWDETLDAALPQLRAHAGTQDLDIQTAADRLTTAGSGKITRAQLFELMQTIGWIVRPAHGNGWHPTLEARALDVAYSRTVALPAGAGSYEQCFLTNHGYQLLEQHIIAALAASREDDNR